MRWCRVGERADDRKRQVEKMEGEKSDRREVMRPEGASRVCCGGLRWDVTSSLPWRVIICCWREGGAERLAGSLRRED